MAAWKTSCIFVGFYCHRDPSKANGVKQISKTVVRSVFKSAWTTDWLWDFMVMKTSTVLLLHQEGKAWKWWYEIQEVGFQWWKRRSWFKEQVLAIPCTRCFQWCPGVCHRTGPKGWIDKKVLKLSSQEPRALHRLPVHHHHRKILFVENWPS